jgi:hypothetical protein
MPRARDDCMYFRPYKQRVSPVVKEIPRGQGGGRSLHFDTLLRHRSAYKLGLGIHGDDDANANGFPVVSDL